MELKNEIINKVRSWFFERVYYFIIVLKDLAVVLLISILVAAGWYVYVDYPKQQNDKIERVLLDGWQRHNYESGLKSHTIYDLVEGPKGGEVWANTASGIYHYGDGQWHYFEVFNEKIFYGNASNLVLDQVGDLWVTLDKKRDSYVTAFGLWKLVDGQFKKIKKGTFEILAAADGGGVWTADRFSHDYLLKVGKLESSINLKEKVPIGFGPRALTLGKNDSQWFFTSKSFGKLEQDSLIAYTDDDPEFENYPGKILNVDFEVSTNRKGLFLVQLDSRDAYVWPSKGEWKHYDNIWLAISASQKEIKGGDQNTYLNTPLWSKTQNGIIISKNKMLKDSEWELIDQVSHLTPLQISCVLIKKDNEIWFGTIGDGIYVCKSDEYL